MEQRQSQQQEMQRAMSTRRERKNDVPFGVRAIQSGIEVDGVWISRGNTPLPGSPVSLATRSPPKQQRNRHGSSALGSMSSIPDLSMPQPAQPIAKPLSGRSTNASSRSVSPDSRFERSRGSSIASHSPRRGLSPQPSGDFASHRRQSYRPRQSSHLRYSNAGELASSEDDDIVTDPNRPPQHNLRSKCAWVYRNRCSPINRLADVRSGSDSSLSPEPYAGHYMPTKPSPTKVANRRSLGPPRTLSPTSISPTIGHAGQFSFERIPLDNLATPASSHNDPFLTPRESPTDEGKGYFGNGSSFQNFVETDPKSQHQSLVGNSSPEDHENPYPDHADGSTPNARNGDVIRKVNSGFEILRPGTLGQKKSEAPETYQPTGADNKRYSRKLQKRVRSSTSASRKSMFSEDVV